ncbi:MAG: hypothetical protein ACF8OB_18940 [Phycisphaeraceae bacterium JB051]
MNRMVQCALLHGNGWCDGIIGCWWQNRIGNPRITSTGNVIKLGLGHIGASHMDNEQG